MPRGALTSTFVLGGASVSTGMAMALLREQNSLAYGFNQAVASSVHPRISKNAGWTSGNAADSSMNQLLTSETVVNPLYSCGCAEEFPVLLS